MVSWFFMVFGFLRWFHGFWLVSMVFQRDFMFVHSFWLVSMVFQGGFMVYHSFVGKRSRNAKNEFQKYKNAKKQILLKKSINRGCGSQTCHSIPDSHGVLNLDHHRQELS